MRAMIFAAGVGSRLQPLTKDKPKCLIEVAGKTMLQHVIERLQGIGVSHIVINLHHYPELIREYIERKRSFGIEIKFSYEPYLLDTGGGLKAVADYFSKEPHFIVHNCDIYSDIDLRHLISEHCRYDALATLAVQKREAARQLLFDDDYTLRGWVNHSSGARSVCLAAEASLELGFCGIQVLSPQIFEVMREQEQVFSIISSYLLAVEKGFTVRGVLCQGRFWIDMGSSKNLGLLREKIG